jgi:site-specific DNA-cytosine methylase
MMEKLRVVELYAGIGRTWAPFKQWRQCELALLVDSDQLACDNYTDNFPKAPYWRRDLLWVRPSELQQEAGGRVDVLLGCPPCQGFSDTGKRDPDDPRNVHVSVFGSFAVALRPLAIVMENVPLLASSRRFRLFTTRLERAGYTWTAAILNAALYGSCQTRQRLLFVAFRNDLGKAPSIPAPTHGGNGRYFAYHSRKFKSIQSDPGELLGTTPGTTRLQKMAPAIKNLGRSPIPTIADALSGLPPVGSADGVAMSHTMWQTSPAMTRRMSNVPEGGRWRGGEDHFSHAYGRLHRHGLARTITTYFANPGSGRFWHYAEDRPITVREAARIQGVEDDFLFQGPQSGAARLIGNALDRALAEAAYLTVRKGLG